MEAPFYTVEQAADRLRLHPKTVRRFIREERLRATRIGKSYRILRSDLEAFAGVVSGNDPAPHEARVTSIVDVEQVEARLAERLAITLPSVRNSRQAHSSPMSLTTSYDPDRKQLKVVIVGSPADVAETLKLVDFLLEREP